MSDISCWNPVKRCFCPPQDSYGSQSAEPAAPPVGATGQASPRRHLEAPAAPLPPQHRLLPRSLRPALRHQEG